MVRINVPIVSVITVVAYANQPRTMWQSSTGDWYLLTVDGNTFDLYLLKSSDGRITWREQQLVEAGSVQAFDGWQDGDVLHLAYIENAGDNTIYVQYDMSTDTLGTPVTVFDGASVGSAGSQSISITKAVGGNIYIAYNFGDATEEGFSRSTDGGSSFSARTTCWEAAVDQILIFPGNEADNQDIWALFWDWTANEISLKVYDDSGNSWSETAIATATEPTSSNPHSNMSGVVMPNGHLYAAFWTGSGSTADLLSWDINGAASITAKTNIKTDDAAGQIVAMMRIGSTVYAFYSGSDEGGDTGLTVAKVWFQKSTDGMTTWSAEEAISLRLRNNRSITCPQVATEIAAVWRTEDDPILDNLSGFDALTTAEFWWTNVEVLRVPRAQSLVGI